MFERLREPSTQKGIAVLSGSIIALFNPALAQPVVTLVGAIYGVIEMVRKETVN